MYSNFQNFFTKKLIKQIKDTQQAVNLPLFSFSSNVLTFQYSKGVGWNKYDKSIIQFHINNSKIKALVIQNLDQQRTEKVLEKDWEYIKKVDIEIIDVKNPKFVMENFKHFTRIDNLDL